MLTSLPDDFRAALRLWLTRPVQALLSMLGVAVGIAGVFVVLAVGRGAETQVQQAMARLGAGTVLIVPAAAVEDESRAEIPTSILATLAGLMPVTLDLLSPQREAEVFATSSVGGGATARVVGVTDAHALLAGQRVLRGRGITSLDVFRRERVCVLGDGIARALFPRGDALGQPLRLGDQWFRVVGLLPDEGLALGKPAARGLTQTIYVPLDAPLFANDAPYSVLALRFAGEDALARALPLLERAVALTSTQSPVALELPLVALRGQQSVQRSVAGLLLAASLIALGIAGVGVMNTMLLNVASRRSEIGLRRAIGATRRHILGQFLLEAVVLTGLGGIGGALVGLVSVVVVELATGWPLSSDGVTLLGSIAVAFLVGAVFGGYPAWRAAGLAPVDTLRGPV